MKITGLRTYMQRVDDRPRLLVKIETDEEGRVHNARDPFEFSYVVCCCRPPKRRGNRDAQSCSQHHDP